MDFLTKYLRPTAFELLDKVIAKFSVEGESVVNFVMSDIHGMAELFDKLLNMLLEEYTDPIAARFIFLGDYVDRGAYSAQVVSMVMYLQNKMPEGRVIALKGNHEDMFIEYYAKGGVRMLPDRTATSFNNNPVPIDMLDWIDDLPCSYEDELHYYVHAGLNPDWEFYQQKKNDLIWIRHRFLNSDKNFGKHVFHGHTAKDNLELKENRTNVDTAGCFGGYLTCAIVHVNSVKAYKFLQASHFHERIVYNDI